jgi:hypothetical protein
MKQIDNKTEEKIKRQASISIENQGPVCEECHKKGRDNPIAPGLDNEMNRKLGSIVKEIMGQNDLNCSERHKVRKKIEGLFDKYREQRLDDYVCKENCVYCKSHITVLDKGQEGELFTQQWR